MAGLLDRAYSLSPVWLQQFGIGLYGLLWKRTRYGGVFHDATTEFSRREGYSQQQWEDYQTQQLRRLLSSVIAVVPYYSEVFARCGITPAQLDHFRLRDLATLPLLEKETIRKRSADFIAKDVDQRRLQTYLTSGTSGTPLAIRYSGAMHQLTQAAYEVRGRRWAGLDYKKSRAMIGGRLVVAKANAKPPFWRYNPAERQLYMSAFHISPQNAPYYAQALNHYKPDYLVGYASSHYFLARMIRELGITVHQPKAILTSSEKLLPEMRDTLQQVYGCPVFDGYSGVEGCCLATECEYHRLHISPDVGIVELVDAAGNPVPVGEPGEIVATGLLNFVQPLIRYRTGDSAILSAELCPCGRQMPVLSELIGRIEDVVVGTDGREMVRFHGIFVGLAHVREGQVIQETLSQFSVRLVVEPGFGDDDRRLIRKRFEERLGDVDVAIDVVDQIERTQSGKFRAVLSNVNRVSADQQIDVGVGSRAASFQEKRQR